MALGVAMAVLLHVFPKANAYCPLCSPKPSLVVNTLTAAEWLGALQHTIAGDLRDLLILLVHAL